MTTIKLKIVKPDQPDYNTWNNRGVNLRFEGHPAEIIPVNTIDALAAALQHAVDEGLRPAVRGGGHCLENFVSNPDVEVVIDISAMKGVRYDEERNAIEVTAGTTLGEMQEALYHNWGTVLPTGQHPAVGVGGHIPGGAFGFMHRLHGLGVDYLYAVEVLCVNKERQVEKIIATSDPSDEHRELWWAHTGGGAGNFGVATRYWFRKPGNSKDPAELLPKAPAVVETIELEWPWSDMDENAFRQLVNNFGHWSYAHGRPDSDALNVFATMHLWNKVLGKIQLKGLVFDPSANAADDFIQAINGKAGIPCTVKKEQMSWLDFALNPFPDIFSGGKAAFKVKDAFLCKPYTAEQLGTIYHYLAERNDIPGGNVGLATYGGQVNSVAADATSSAQRGAIMATACVVGWMDPEAAAGSMDWVRNCYSDLFKATGGAPVPGDQTGGSVIAHPDNDLADPTWNRSGVPWHTFYYQDNYPRLQQVKAKWDPLNIFRPRLSVQAAGL